MQINLKYFRPTLSFLLFVCLLRLINPLPSYGLSIDDLTTDFSQNKPLNQNNTKPINQENLESSLFDGDVQFMMQQLEIISEEKPDLVALKAIGYIAGNKLELGRSTLVEAEKNDADASYILYAKAMLLRLTKDYTNAEQIIRKAITLNKSHPYPWNILGRVQFDQKNYMDAISSFNKAISLNKNFLPAYLNLGATYIEMKNYRQALVAFSDAEKLNFLESRAYLGQTWVHELTIQYGKAISSLKKYIELTGEQIDSLEYLAELQNKAEDYNGLLATGKTLGKTDINKGLTWQVRANIYLDQQKTARKKIEQISINSAEKQYLAGLLDIIEKNYQSAAQQIHKSLELNPTFLASQLANSTLSLLLNNPIKIENKDKSNRLLNYYQGLKAVQENNFNMALTALNKSEGMLPSFSYSGISEDALKKAINKDNVAPIGLGTFYYFIKMPKHGQEIFESVIKANSTSLLGNYWLGQIYLEKGQRESAYKYFENSIGQAEFFPSLYTLAELNLLNGKTDLAKDYYIRALKLKNDPGILIKLGLIYEKSGNLSDVEKVYTQLIESNKDLYIGYNQLAWFYTKNGIKLDKALELAEKANELLPGNSSILDTIGWIYYQDSKFKTAIDYAQKANEIVQGNPTVLYHLGAIYKELGEKELARTYLQQALEVSSQFEAADAAKKMLKNL